MEPPGIEIPGPAAPGPTPDKEPRHDPPLTTKPWLASLALVALALTLSVSVALADDGKTVQVRTIVL
ncbi:MAG: hypothetical protein IPM94_10145 [bacterium]|nr:hypothetical protein [bacterium]